MGSPGLVTKSLSTCPIPPSPGCLISYYHFLLPGGYLCFGYHIHIKGKKKVEDLMPVYALFTSVCYNHMTCPPHHPVARVSGKVNI